MSTMKYFSDIPMELYNLPNDEARAQWCKRKSEEARNKYFQGKAEMTEQVMTQKRWSKYSHARKKEIAEAMWSSHALAKKLVGDEQMFSRWANMYAATATATAITLR